MNGIGVNIFGIDKLTGQLGQWAKGWHGSLSGVAGAAGDGISKVGSFVGGFATVGAIASMVALGAAVKGVSDGLSDAASKQTEFIASSSDLSQTLGVPMLQAQKLNERLQGELATIAGALPGVTADFVTVQNGLTGTLGKMFTGDEAGYSSNILDMSKRIGLLASMRKVDAGMSASAINRLLAGTSGFGEISQVDIFQKNPMLTDGIRQAADQMGLDVSEFKEWTSKQRLEVIQSGLKFAAPDSLAASFTGTAESILQSMQTNMFDPIIGVFGFLRRIPKMGDRHALDAFAGYLQSFQALMGSLGELGKKLGLKGDPMEGLIVLFDFLAQVNNTIAGVLSGVTIPDLSGVGSGMSFEGVVGFLDGLAAQAIPMFNDLTGRLLNWLGTIDFATLGYQVGNAIGTLISLGVTNLTRINWGNIVGILVGGLLQALVFLGGVITGLIAKLARKLLGFLRSKFELVKPQLVAFMDGILKVVRVAQRILNPSLLVGDAARSVAGFVTGKPQSPPSAIGSFLSGASPTLGTQAPLLQPIAPLVTPSPLLPPIAPLVTPNVSSPRSSVFSPTVTVNAGSLTGSPQSLADDLMSRLDRMYSQHKDQQLLQPGF
jgi:hypothetical protein